MALKRNRTGDYRDRAQSLLAEALAVTEPERLGAIIQEVTDRRKLVQASLRDLTAQVRQLRAACPPNEDSPEIYSLLGKVPAHDDELNLIADTNNGLVALRELRPILQVAATAVARPILSSRERLAAVREAEQDASERAKVVRARPPKIGTSAYALALDQRVRKLEGAPA